jgi:hypothetical protein
MPPVVSGASWKASAPKNGGEGGGDAQAAAPKVDFASKIQSLLKTLEDAGSSAKRGSVNTYG